MILLRNLHLLILSASTLGIASHPLIDAEPRPHSISSVPNILSPRARPDWLTTQSTGAHLTWGKYAITFWKSAAILPVVAAATPLRDFYTKATLAAVQASIARVETNRYTFGLGALNLCIDTLDGTPIDWQMLILFTGNMVGETKKGWTGHYMAMVKDKVTGVLTLISLEAVGGMATAWLSGGTTVEQFPNNPFGS